MAEGQSAELDLQPPTPAIPSGPRSPPVELVLSLPDFLDCFPPPHVGRIVSGLDVLTRPECGVAPDAVFTFQRRGTTSSCLYVCLSVCLSVCHAAFLYNVNDDTAAYTSVGGYHEAAVLRGRR